MKVGLAMKRVKRLSIILFLSIITVVMDTGLFLLKKIKSISVFPGG